MPDIITVALKNTLIYTACGFAFGLVAGPGARADAAVQRRALPLDRHRHHRVLPRAARPWSSSSRSSVGIPIAFPGYEVPCGNLGTVTLALGLVGGAYMAETIRAGIQAVPKGQMEAARSLGMSHSRAMVSIVIPQAFRIILPPLTNELILLTKDSSLVYILGLSTDHATS